MMYTDTSLSTFLVVDRHDTCSVILVNDTDKSIRVQYILEKNGGVK